MMWQLVVTGSLLGVEMVESSDSLGLSPSPGQPVIRGHTLQANDLSVLQR